MAEVITQLSDDEFTVLSIASQGESLADLGQFSRWSAPINSLLRRGLMIQKDKFNNIITPAGKEALEGHEKDQDKVIGRMIEVSSQIGAAQAKIRDMVNQVSDALVAIGKESNKVTGEDARLAARRWASIAADEAVKKLQEP